MISPAFPMNRMRRALTAAITAGVLAIIVTGQTPERTRDVVTLDIGRPGPPISPTIDNLRSYGTPNYYVQKMYATNLGHVLRVDVNGSEKNAQNGLYTSASIDQKNGEVILKAVNATPAARTVRVDLKGTGSIQGNSQVTVLGSSDLEAENNLDQPLRLAPAEKALAASSNGFDLTLDPQSFTVLRAKYSK